MSPKKIFFLVIFFVIPSLLFFFLRFFGKNEFEVKPLYEEGVPNPPPGCSYSYTPPYLIPDSVLRGGGDFNGFLVLSFSNDANHRKALDEITYEFQSDPVKIKCFLLKAGGVQDKLIWEEVYLDQSLWGDLKKCVFLLSGEETLVLLDQEKRIRGSYRGQDEEEIDRLRAELAILLKKY